MNKKERREYHRAVHKILIEELGFRCREAYPHEFYQGRKVTRYYWKGKDESKRLLDKNPLYYLLERER